MDNQPNQLLSLIRELTNNSQRIAAIEVEKYDLDREKRRCEQLVAEDSKVIFGKLTPIVERYFGISGYKITLSNFVKIIMGEIILLYIQRMT